MSGKRERELTGRHVLLMLVAFFGITIAVNAIFITKAVESFTGEDVKRSYRQGLEYNQTIESREKQAELGWQVKTNLVEESGDTPRFIIRVTDRNDIPVRGLSIDGILKRPTDLAKDETIMFTERGDGKYDADLTLDKGQWILKATATQGEQAFRFEDSLLISE